MGRRPSRPMRTSVLMTSWWRFGSEPGALTDHAAGECVLATVVHWRRTVVGTGRQAGDDVGLDFGRAVFAWAPVVGRDVPTDGQAADDRVPTDLNPTQIAGQCHRAVDVVGPA